MSETEKKTKPPTDPSQKVFAYKLSRPDCGGWMFVGTTPADAALALESELEMDDINECHQIVIESYETTQGEIDNMPEFEGW